MSEVRIWKFGARAPLPPKNPAHRTLFDDVLYGSHRYYNQLVEIERARLASYAAIRRELAPELARVEDEYQAADEEIEKLVREVKKARQQHWRATKGEATLAIGQSQRDRLAQLKARRKALGAEAKPLRKAFNERMKPARELFKERAANRAQLLAPDSPKPGPRIRSRANAEVLEEMIGDERVDEAWRRVADSDRQAHERQRKARAECQLPPGTYLQVEDAFRRACRDATGAGPRFRRFTGGGKVAVQLHKTKFEDLLAGTTMLQLVPDIRPSKRSSKKHEFYTVKIRIGSRPDRSPIWAELPVRLHRLPPKDAQVKWAWIKVRRQGERLHYELQLTLRHPDLAKAKRPAGVGHGGHVQIGWSQRPEGVRVALWPDGELVVPSRMLERAERSERLIGHADTHYDEVRRVLRRMDLMGERGRIRYDRMKGRRARLWLRRQVDRAARLVLRADELWRRWRLEALDAGRDLFPPLHEADRWLCRHVAKGPWDASDDPRPTQSARLLWWLFLWTKKDRHLRQWSADARAGFEHSRDAFFRDCAIRLSTQYETLSVDNYSIASLKKRPAPLTLPGEAPIEQAQHNAQLAAPGRFREILIAVMGERCTQCARPDEDAPPAAASAR